MTSRMVKKYRVAYAADGDASFTAAVRQAFLLIQNLGGFAAANKTLGKVSAGGLGLPPVGMGEPEATPDAQLPAESDAKKVAGVSES